MSPSKRLHMGPAEQVQQILKDFVFLDCRLGDHPKVQACVRQVVGDKLVSVARSDGDQLFEEEFSLPIRGSVAGLAAQGRRVYEISADLVEMPERYPSWLSSLPHIRSLLAVPIIAGDGVIGVLSLHSVDANAFGTRHLGRAQILAAVVAYISSLTDTSQRVRNAQSESLARALRAIREELNLTQAELADRVGTSRIAVSRWEDGAQRLTFGPLCRWCQALGLLQSKSHALVTTVDVTPEFVRLLRQDPALLHQLSPEAFENLIGERLYRMGFDIQKTGTTALRDGGIDLVAIPKVRTVASYLMAVQVKHHAQGARTGRTPVDRLLSWKDSPFRLGLIVTNTGFTRDALWTALRGPNRDFLRLRGFSDLKRWLEGNFWCPEEWRELPTQIEVAPGIVIAIPKGELRDWFDIWPLSENRET